MKKLLWLIILGTTAYGIMIFMKPDITNWIESVLWFEWFWDDVRSKLWFINNTVTDIPSISEFQSWALDLKNKVTDWIQSTKDTIDTVRSTLSWAEDTYNKAKDVITETTQTIDKIKWTLDDVGALWNTITWAVNTDIVD